MLSSIHPFGERSRNSKWWLTISSYLAGSLLGGLSMGLLAGALGVGLRSIISAKAAVLVLAAIGLLGVAADLGLAGLRLPGVHRQVNERWLTQYRGWVYGGGFGFQLGLGVATIITTSLVWVTWAAALLTGSVTGSIMQSLFIGATFGVARGGFIFATARVHEPAQLRSLHRSIDKHAPTIHKVSLATALLLALGAATVGAL